MALLSDRVTVISLLSRLSARLAPFLASWLPCTHSFPTLTLADASVMRTCFVCWRVSAKSEAAYQRKKPADSRRISRRQIVTDSLVTEVTGELVASTARSGTSWASGSAASTARSGTGWCTASSTAMSAAALTAAHLWQTALLQQAAEAVALAGAAARRSTAVRRSWSTARSGWSTAARSNSSASIAAAASARSSTARTSNSTASTARCCTGRS